MSRHHLPTGSAVNMARPRAYLGLPGDGPRRRQGPRIGGRYRHHRHYAQFEIVGYAGDLGTQVTAKNPNYINQIGFDVGMVSADGILMKGFTSTTLAAVGKNRSVATANADPPSDSCIICRAPPEGLNHGIPLPFLAAWHKFPDGG